MSLWALLGWILWLLIKKLLWELAETSLHEIIRVFCSNAESRFGCAIFRTLRSVLRLFTSCVWDVLRYRILRKKQLLIFSETWSSSFWIVCNCFDVFRTNRPKNNGRSHRKENTNFPKWRWVHSKNVCLSSALLFSLVVTKIFFKVSLLGTIRVFCSNAESRFGCAIFRTLRSVLWLFTSCVWDVSRYRILREKIAFDFFGNVVFVVLDCVRSFWRFLYKSLKNVGQCHQNQITFLLKWRWGRPKVFALSCASLVSLVVNEKAVVRSSRLMFAN